MNKKDRYIWEKKVLSNFDRTILTRKNSLSECGSRGLTHELAVFTVCRFLRCQSKDVIKVMSGDNQTEEIGYYEEIEDSLLMPEILNLPMCDFYTEVRSADRKFRADILAMTNPPTIIEVADSESEESLERKKKYWNGLNFEFLIVRV